MCGLDVHDVSRRAFAARRRGSRRAVPLCIDGRREGHFDVRLRGVHVVDVVRRVRASVYGVSTSCAAIWNRWYHGIRPTESRARSRSCIHDRGGEGVNVGHGELGLVCWR